jgi:hypothetical protein
MNNDTNSLYMITEIVYILWPVFKYKNSSVRVYVPSI